MLKTKLWDKKKAKEACSSTSAGSTRRTSPQSTVSDIEVTFVSADGEKTASFGAREPDKG